MEFKEFTSWLSDDMPKTTKAVVVVSSCGKVVKRLSYTKWNKQNNNYSNMKEYIYTQSSNRGKQRYDSEEKKAKYGVYKHVEINGKVHSVHRVVAITFIENDKNLPCVNHINGIRDDNRVENLEWVSNQDNVTHAWETGMRDVTRMMKIQDSDLPAIIEMKKTGMSNPKIGKVFGVTGETIRIRVKNYENSICS